VEHIVLVGPCCPVSRPESQESWLSQHAGVVGADILLAIVAEEGRWDLCFLQEELARPKQSVGPAGLVPAGAE
jgi:hypothetical protein